MLAVRPLRLRPRVPQLERLPVEPRPPLAQALVRPEPRKLLKMDESNAKASVQRHVVWLRRDRAVPLPVRPEPVP